MKKALLIMFACACMCACRTQKVVTEHHDTLYANKVQVDTFYQSKIEFDSIFFRDSIFVYANDSVQIKEIWKWREKYIYKTDTIHDLKSATDTIYKTNIDYKVVCDELSKWQKLKLDCGEFFMAMVVVLLGVMIIPLFDKDKK